MKRASSEDLNNVRSDYDKEFTDIGNIINQKVSQMAQNQSSSGTFNRRHGFSGDGKSGNKMSKRQQRSMKELHAIQSLEVWEEILDENALTADDFDSSRSSNFDITLRRTPKHNLSAKKRSRKSSMFAPNMAALTNDNWNKSKSIECLAEELETIEQRNSRLMGKVISYSEWDLAEGFGSNVKDHNNVIDLYIKGNIVNLITGSDFFEYDQTSLIKCGKINNTVNTKSPGNIRRKSKMDLEEMDHFKPRIVDVVFKESYIKYSLNRAEREGDVQQTKFWLLELEKLLSAKFYKEESQPGEILT